MEMQTPSGLKQPFRAFVSVVQVGQREFVQLDPEDDARLVVRASARVRDDDGVEMETLPVVGETRVGNLEAACGGSPVELLAMVVPVPAGDGTKRPVLQVLHQRAGEGTLALLHATHEEIARTRALVAELDGLGIRPLDYIKAQLETHLAIVGLADNPTLELAMDAIIFQALATGRHGNASGKISLLHVGPPGSGKKLGNLMARVVNPRYQYAQSSTVTLPGITGATRPRAGGFEAAPGLLGLADMGVVVFEDFHDLRRSHRQGVHSLLAKVMEDGVFHISTAAQQTGRARTALLLDLNRRSDLGKRPRGLLDDIGLPANLLSRFDLIVTFTTSAEQRTAVARGLAHAYAGERGGSAVELYDDAPWVRELRLLVAFLRDRIDPDTTGIRDLLSQEIGDLLEPRDSLLLGHARIAISALKFVQAICRGWNRPVADPEVVAEAMALLDKRVAYLQALDDEEQRPVSWSASDRRRWLALKFAGDEVTLEELARAYRDQAGHTACERTFRRDLEKIGARKRGKGVFLVPSSDPDRDT